jgi:hypothetical protein
VVASRSAYRYRFLVPRAQRADLGTSRIDTFLTTAPGALVLALGHKALERVQADLRKDARPFLARIGRTPTRQAFEKGAPLVWWTEVGDALLSRKERDRWIAAVGKAHPDLPGALYEAATLSELCDEASVSLDVNGPSVRLLMSLGVL